MQRKRFRQEEVPRVPKQLERFKKWMANPRKEIKCESYGFGEERRLHLFKKQNGAAPTGGGIYRSKLALREPLEIVGLADET